MWMSLAWQTASLTAADRAAGVNLLTDSSWALRTATTNLTDRQWRFEPGPGRWAIADIVEHLSRSEQAVFQLITAQLVRTPPVPANRRSTLKDLAVILAVRNRNRRFPAADVVRPLRTWTDPAEVARQFGALRIGTINYLTRTTDDLRGWVADHPVLGVIDAYQWLLFLGAHTHRHIDQLLEVKADPGFPAG